MSHFYLRVSPADKVKIIISVSKKVAKKAVTRNLVRRRVRPIVKQFKLKPAQYMLIAKLGAENIKGAELKLELEKLFKL